MPWKCKRHVCSFILYCTNLFVLLFLFLTHCSSFLCVLDWIGSCCSFRLPEGFSQLRSLRVLSLNDVSLYELPADFGGFVIKFRTYTVQTNNFIGWKSCRSWNFETIIWTVFRLRLANWLVWSFSTLVAMILSHWYFWTLCWFTRSAFNFCLILSFSLAVFHWVSSKPSRAMARWQSDDVTSWRMFFISHNFFRNIMRIIPM